MTAENDIIKAAAESQPPLGDLPKEGRRRLLRGGLGAAPVLMTLAGMPRRAAGASGGSANLSGNTAIVAPCAGCSPSAWASAQWPDTVDVTSKFNDVFGARLQADPTLRQVLASTALGDEQRVAQHCAAAYLNAMSGKTPPSVLGVEQVRRVWASYEASGTYQPVLRQALEWRADEIVRWIETSYA